MMVPLMWRRQKAFSFLVVCPILMNTISLGPFLDIFLLNHSIISFNLTKMFNFDFFLSFFLVFGVWQQFDLDMDGNYDIQSWVGRDKKKLFLPKPTNYTIITHIAPFVCHLRCILQRRVLCVDHS